MFSFSKGIGGDMHTCTAREFWQLADNPQVKATCQKIARLQQELKLLQKAEKTDTPTADDADGKAQKSLKEQMGWLKKSLPGFCFQAHFPDGKRNNKGAVASGFTMLDVDKVEHPQALWEGMKPKAARLGIVLAHVTPSTQGMRIVFLTPTGMDYARAQQLMAKALGLNAYDTCTKDAARLSFAVPRDYLLYVDEERLFAEHPQTFGTVPFPNLSTPQPINASTPQPCEASQPPTPSAVRNTFKGIPYDEIIRRLLFALGVDGEPQEGERNNMLYALTRQMRYICDFDIALLTTLLPHWGLPANEVTATVTSAVASARKSRLPPTLDRIIKQCEQEMQESDTDDSPPDEIPDSPPLPQLPRFLKLLLKTLPKAFHKAAIISALPILGTLATRVRGRYIDGTQHSLSFISCVVAPQGTGKSFTRILVNYLLAQLMEQDRLERIKEQRYNEEKRNARNSKKQPADPRAQIRILPAAISNSMLFKRLDCARGKHCFSYIEEVDALTRNNRLAWAQKDDILRQSFDNSTAGVCYLSENSWSAMLPVYYNLLLCGTPGAVLRFFKDVEGGLAGRVSITTLPDMLGSAIPVFKRLSEEEEVELQQGVTRLMNEGSPQSNDETVEYHTPRLGKAMAKWLEEQRMAFLKNQSDPSMDIFRRRACVIGWRGGLIAYLLCGHQETNMVLNFARWVASYVMGQQMRIFGKQMNQIIEEDYQQMNITAKTETPVQSLYEQLPDNFDLDTLVRMRREAGQSTNVRMVLNRWERNGMVEKTGKNKWNKLKTNTKKLC